MAKTQALSRIVNRVQPRLVWWAFGAVLSCTPVPLHGQITTVSPPLFTAPLVPTTFPGAVPLVPVIGTSLTKIEEVAVPNSVLPADDIVNAVADAPSDPTLLLSADGSEKQSRASRIGALPPVSAVAARSVTGGLTLDRLAARTRVGAAPGGTLAMAEPALPNTALGHDALAGAELNALGSAYAPASRRVRVEDESASFSKLDPFSPEVLASRPVSFRAAETGLNRRLQLPAIKPAPATIGASLVFHPSVIDGVLSGSPRTRKSLTSGTSSPLAGSRKGVLASSPMQKAAPRNQMSVPKIPQVGIGSRSTSTRIP